MSFTRTDFSAGQRVSVSGLSDGRGTFLGYGVDGDEAFGACSERHLSYPGMRLVAVRLDAYPAGGEGCSHFWERDCSPLAPDQESRAAELHAFMGEGWS